MPDYAPVIKFQQSPPDNPVYYLVMVDARMEGKSSKGPWVKYTCSYNGQVNDFWATPNLDGKIQQGGGKGQFNIMLDSSIGTNGGYRVWDANNVEIILSQAQQQPIPEQQQGPPPSGPQAPQRAGPAPSGPPAQPQGPPPVKEVSEIDKLALLVGRRLLASRVACVGTDDTPPHESVNSCFIDISQKNPVTPPPNVMLDAYAIINNWGWLEPATTEEPAQASIPDQMPEPGPDDDLPF